MPFRQNELKNTFNQEQPRQKCVLGNNGYTFAFDSFLNTKRYKKKPNNGLKSILEGEMFDNGHKWPVSLLFFLVFFVCTLIYPNQYF